MIMRNAEDKVSVIITIFNGGKWIDQCFDSILKQKLEPDLKLEISVYDDASLDDTLEQCFHWRQTFENQAIDFVLSRNDGGAPKGVGYGRNRAIEASTGEYLCFQDIDDEMLPERIGRQYMLARRHKDAIVGAQFLRVPSNSTCRFSSWANELPAEKLTVQIYTSNGPTIIMPTWFCHRRVYNRIPGGFSEAGHGTPEDLIFFYKHLENGGSIMRCDSAPLLLYRYHPEATTFTVKQETIRYLRLEFLLKHVLVTEPWSTGFMIWNAGKQGRRFFRDLPLEMKNKVTAFCDIDQKKIDRNYQHFDEKEHRFTHSIPVIHFSKAVAPVVICMKLNLTNGAFEENLKSLSFRERQDYVLFT